jgi:hypothetical protein
MVFHLKEEVMKYLLLFLVLQIPVYAVKCGFGCYTLEPATEKRKKCWFDCANRGDLWAQYQLGMNYFLGDDGFKQDFKLSYKWISDCAEKGMAPAQAIFGMFFDRGIVVPLDKAKALEWTIKAAEKNHVKSQLLVSYRYFKGIGVEKDLVKAYMWCLIAESSGSEQAKVNKKQFKGLIDFKEKLKAKMMMLKWRRKHPKNIDPITGRAKPLDQQVRKILAEAGKARSNNKPDEARKHYLRCAKLGDASCINDYGYMCAKYKKDMDHGLKITLKQLKKTPDDACLNDTIGWLYYNKGNYGKSLKYLKKAEELAPEVPDVKEHIAVVEKAIRKSK